MNKTTRRTFIKQTGASLTGLATLGPSPRDLLAVASEPASIRPHRAIEVPGVHAYALEHSVASGQMLNLCVSASVPYRLSICRLSQNMDDPSEPSRRRTIREAS